MPKYLFALLKSFCTKYEQSDETAVDKDSLIVYSPIQDFEKKASILLNINQELLDSDLPQNIKKEMSSPLLVIGQMFTIDLRNLLTFLLEYKNTEVLELQEIIEFFSLLCNTIFPVTSQFLGIKNMQDSQTSSPIIEKNPLKDDSIPFHFSYEE